MQTKHVVLAVSGSIAAYKSPIVASLLRESGIEVRPLLTQGGSRFITALSLEVVTEHAVQTSLWDSAACGPMAHLELAHWAHVIAVVPASADTIARLAQGRADDLLGAAALSFTGSLVIAPAMESHMFEHEATQANLRTLTQRGAHVIGPDSGRLASGAQGLGRMAGPGVIAAEIEHLLRATDDQTLKGKAVLVTAGPTHEPIDPVRFISNRSSGKMGYAVAKEAQSRGAKVTLITGPTDLMPLLGVGTVRVETANEMLQAVLGAAASQDVFVMCAAVSDFRVARVKTDKVKRGTLSSLTLEPTDDIAALAVHAAPDAFHIGFALESTDLIERARAKLRSKGLALVVGNEVNTEHNPFGADDNIVAFVQDQTDRILPRMSKRRVAIELWNEIETMMREK